MLSKIEEKINSSQLLIRVKNAIFFGIGGSAASRILNMLGLIALSRILGKEYYGQFSMVNSTVTMFVIFSGVGMGATLTRYVSLYRNDKNKLGNIIGTLNIFVALLSVGIMVALFYSASNLSYWISESFYLENYFKLASIAIFFSALSSIQQSTLLGMEKYRENAKIEVIQAVFSFIFTLIFSVLWGINGAIGALIFSNLLKFILLYKENYNQYKIQNIILRYKFNKEIKKIILNFTVPVFISSLFVIPVNWMNDIILAKNSGFGELAIFNIAIQWMTIITYIPIQMNQVRPIYTNLYAEKKYNDLIKLVKRITLGSIVLVLPIVLMGSLLSKNILRLYGVGYETGNTTFILLMIAALIITVQSQIGSLFQAIGAMWIGFFLNFIWAGCIIIIFYNLRYLGSVGYALAYCISYGIHTFLSFIGVSLLLKRSRKNENRDSET